MSQAPLRLGRHQHKTAALAAVPAAARSPADAPLQTNRERSIVVPAAPSINLPQPLPSAPVIRRFAAGEYLDAGFLTKLMCIGRELHDFLTLPAQVRH